MAETIYSTPWDRDRRLRSLSLALDGFDEVRGPLLDVIRASVAGRAFSTPNNSRSSPGYNAWDYAVRVVRDIYCGKSDWKKYESNGVEGIVNHKLRAIITIVSTDDGTCDLTRSPRNRTHKGPATEKITDLNRQFDLDLPKNAEASEYELWELCIFDDGGDVLSELSRPIKFSGGFFLQFSERIFLIEPGEWSKIRLPESGDDEGQDFEPKVRRK